MTTPTPQLGDAVPRDAQCTFQSHPDSPRCTNPATTHLLVPQQPGEAPTTIRSCSDREHLDIARWLSTDHHPLTPNCDLPDAPWLHASRRHASECLTPNPTERTTALAAAEHSRSTPLSCPGTLTEHLSGPDECSQAPSCSVPLAGHARTQRCCSPPAATCSRTDCAFVVLNRRIR